MKDLIITGIPRSGTSLISSMLHRFDNCVVLNEPGETYEAIDGADSSWQMPELFLATRARILAGKPVLNKFSQGRLAEDTFLKYELSYYTPKVKDQDFTLGMKHTLTYLARIEELARIFPQAVFLAMVRDPFQTIASWKSTFDHLKRADGTGFPIGSLSDKALKRDEKLRLEEIFTATEEAERRARYWNYLARIIITHKKRLHIIRYDDLVKDPESCLSPLIEKLNLGKPSGAFPEGKISRGKTAHLTEEDIDAIQRHCLATAAELGLSFSR